MPHTLTHTLTHTHPYNKTQCKHTACMYTNFKMRYPQTNILDLSVAFSLLEDSFEIHHYTAQLLVHKRTHAHIAESLYNGIAVVTFNTVH